MSPTVSVPDTAPPAMNPVNSYAYEVVPKKFVMVDVMKTVVVVGIMNVAGQVFGSTVTVTVINQYCTMKTSICKLTNAPTSVTRRDGRVARWHSADGACSIGAGP